MIFLEFILNFEGGRAFSLLSTSNYRESFTLFYV